ncbi:hypothetical protein LZ32DRAFT_362942 [Colletotrichum eremochloae]|nr:hypothetical protein LZ32DRAFT_362942 [Colletotrichum eremochloae]
MSASALHNHPRSRRINQSRPRGFCHPRGSPLRHLVQPTVAFDLPVFLITRAALPAADWCCANSPPLAKHKSDLDDRGSTARVSLTAPVSVAPNLRRTWPPTLPLVTTGVDKASNYGPSFTGRGDN